MNFVRTLSGGNPKSLGKTQEIVDIVLKNPAQLDKLFDCLFEDDEIVRMRASDALEKIARLNPQRFKAYKVRLLREVPLIRQPSVQWHLAQMLREIKLNDSEQKIAVTILKNNLRTMDDWIVTNLTLEALATFVGKGSLARDEFIRILEKQKSERHKSVQARVNKLLNEFSGS